MLKRELSGTAYKVLGFIATHRDPDGTWSMRRAEVQKALGISQPTLTRALKELKEAGIIKVIEPGGGAGRPTKYMLNLPEGEQIKPLARKVPTETRASGNHRTGQENRGSKHAHHEHVHEHVHYAEVAQLTQEFIQVAASFIAGVLRGLLPLALKNRKRIIFAAIGGGLLGAGLAWIKEKRKPTDFILYSLGGAACGTVIACFLPGVPAEPTTAQQQFRRDVLSYATNQFSSFQGNGQLD